MPAGFTDGKWAMHRIDKRELYSLETGETRPINGIEPRDNLIRWSTDGKAIYTVQVDALQAKVFRPEPGTGKRELLKEIVVSDPAGMMLVISVNVSADGKAYAYTSFRLFSDLFTVEGVK